MREALEHALALIEGANGLAIREDASWPMYREAFQAALATPSSPVSAPSPAGFVGWVKQDSLPRAGDGALPDGMETATGIFLYSRPGEGRVALYTHNASSPAGGVREAATGRDRLVERALKQCLPLIEGASGSEDISVPADDFAVILGLLKATLPNQASAVEAAYERAIQDAERSFRRNKDRSWALSCLRDRIRDELAALSSPATPEPAPLKMLVDREWLREKIADGPDDGDCLAGRMLAPEPVSAPAGEVAVDAAALDQWAYEWVKRLHPETDERKTFRDGYFSGAIHVLGELRNKLCAALSNAPGHGEGGL